MNTSDIIAICQTLKTEGKQPSIALIKSRVTKGTPMPLLIAGLQQWRTNPNTEVTVTETTSSNDTKKPLEQRVDDLEKEVAELHALIKKLL